MQPVPEYEQTAYAPGQLLPTENEAPNLNNRFRNLQPTWYQSSQISRWIGSLSGGTSLFAGGLAAASYFFMPGTPRVVINSVTGLGVASLVSGLASFYFGRGEFWQDPEYRIEQGRKAEDDIVTNSLSIHEIAKKYGSYQKYNLLTSQDLNRILRDKIEDKNLSFKLAIERFMPRANFTFQLDGPNKAAMQAKLMLYLQEKSVDTVTTSEQDFLGITERNLNLYICFPALTQLNENQINYAKFLERVDPARWGSFSPEQLDSLRVHAIPYCKRFGLVEALDRLDVQFLGITMEQLVNAGALKPDELKLSTGNISYGEYREKHSAASYEFLSPVHFDLLKRAYESSYKVMSKYPEDAPLLGIDNLEELRRLAFEREIKTIDSVEELIKKLGTTPFTEKRLTKDDARVKKWVFNHFDILSYHIEKDSHLVKYDLMTAPVSSAVSKAKANEQKLLAAIKAEKEKIKINHKNEKESLESQAKHLKQTRSEDLETSLTLAKGRVSHCNNQITRLETIISTNLKAAGDTRAIAQSLQRDVYDYESSETLRERKRNLTASLEKHAKSKLEFENNKNLPVWEAKIAALKSSIEEKEAQISKIASQTVTGVSAARAAEAKREKLEAEKKAMVSEKEALVKKVEGVKPLISREMEELRESVTAYYQLESQLTTLNVQIEKAEIAEKNERENREKVKLLREAPTTYEIQQKLDNAFRDKILVEQQLQVDNDQVKTYTKQIEDINKVVDQELKLSLKMAEDNYLADLAAVEKKLSNGEDKIHREFREQILLLK